MVWGEPRGLTELPDPLPDGFWQLTLCVTQEVKRAHKANRPIAMAGPANL